MLRAAISGNTIRNSHALVVDALGAAIIAGDYPPGATLPGDLDLATRFDVSRTVLREAMKTLAAKGLIVARARIGTKVNDRQTWNLFDSDILRWHLQQGTDTAFLSHLSEMRLSFEPFAARLACIRARREDIARMYSAADAMAGAGSMEDFALADLDLHMALLEASRNPFMFSVGALIEAALVTSFRVSSPHGDEARQANAAAKHRMIPAAIEKSDPDAAADAVRAVILEGKDRIELTLSRGEAGS